MRIEPILVDAENRVTGRLEQGPEFRFRLRQVVLQRQPPGNVVEESDRPDLPTAFMEQLAGKPDGDQLPRAGHDLRLEILEPAAAAEAFRRR